MYRFIIGLVNSASLLVFFISYGAHLFGASFGYYAPVIVSSGLLCYVTDVALLNLSRKKLLMFNIINNRLGSIACSNGFFFLSFFIPIAHIFLGYRFMKNLTEYALSIDKREAESGRLNVIMNNKKYAYALVFTFSMIATVLTLCLYRPNIDLSYINYTSIIYSLHIALLKEIGALYFFSANIFVFEITALLCLVFSPVIPKPSADVLLYIFLLYAFTSFMAYVAFLNRFIHRINPENSMTFYEKE